MKKVPTLSSRHNIERTNPSLLYALVYKLPCNRDFYKTKKVGAIPPKGYVQDNIQENTQDD